MKWSFGSKRADGVIGLLQGATSAIGIIATVLASHASASERDVDRAVDNMLTALGGKARWAALTTLVNTSMQYRLTEPTEVYAVISMDLTRLRFRIDSTAVGLSVSRVVDGDADWRITREGKVERLPAPLRESDLRWYAGHVYRTIHRLARRDAALNCKSHRWSIDRQ
jgi:hypothetical protein